MLRTPRSSSGDPAGRGTPNSRNGTTPKTVATEVGDLRLDIPRDRAGTFEPRLVPKGARRLGGLDDIIISLYAGGMTIRDIQHHLARTIGTQLSHETISNITDAVLEEVKAWQNRCALSVPTERPTGRDCAVFPRSEERRVGKECRSRSHTHQSK